MNTLWHDLRLKNIGGSEVAALFCESPHTTFYRLWHEKRGLIPPVSLDDNERVQAGRFMEGGAIAWANDRYRSDLYQPAVYIEHADIPGMGCTPDAFDRNDPNLMAQVKIVDWRVFAEKWEADGDTIRKAPLDILLQVQHEMDCTRKKESWLIVVVGGNRLYRMIVLYDPEVGSILRTAVMAFWLRDTPPEPDFMADGDSIREVRKTLPVKEFQDFSGEKYLYKLLKKAQRSYVMRGRAADEYDAAMSEVLHLIGNAERIKCRDIFLEFQKRKSTPDRIITAADVGSTIKGRAESSTPKIKMEGMPL